MATEKSGYDAGYEVGLTWKNSYRPGGPWHYRPRPGTSEEQQKKAKATVDNWREWHRGFDAAIAEKGITLK